MSTMRIIFHGQVILSAALLLGCQENDSEFRTVDPDVEVVEESHSHDHSSGPHGGHLVELGEEQYHAEVTYDGESKGVVVFILASNPDNPHPISEKSVELELEIDGKEVVFNLAAAPQEGDPEGHSSRYQLVGDETLAQHVHDIEDVVGHVTVMIDGTKFTGDVAHDHEHEHAHGEGEHGDHEHDDDEGHEKHDGDDHDEDDDDHHAKKEGEKAEAEAKDDDKAEE